MPTSHPFSQPANQYRLPKIISEGIDRCQTFILFLTWAFFSGFKFRKSYLTDCQINQARSIPLFGECTQTTHLNHVHYWLPSCHDGRMKKGENTNCNTPKVGSSAKAPIKTPSRPIGQLSENTKPTKSTIVITLFPPV